MTLSRRTKQLKKLGTQSKILIFNIYTVYYIYIYVLYSEALIYTFLH